jgi:hypothetical protein
VSKPGPRLAEVAGTRTVTEAGALMRRPTFPTARAGGNRRLARKKILFRRAPARGFVFPPAAA